MNNKYTFLIQCLKDEKDNLIPAFDFCQTAIESVRYMKWLYSEDNIYDYRLVENISECGGNSNEVPVGSVEFVSEWIKTYRKDLIHLLSPINIPISLYSFAGRKISVEDKDSINERRCYDWYIKSHTKIKGYSGIFKSKENLPDDLYFLSEPVILMSEWRAFVKNGELLDIRQYSGELGFFPDIEKVKQTILAYENAPYACTLDFGVTNKGETIIIEVHNFFSCGLYGFSDLKNLPKMLVSVFKSCNI